MTATEVAGRPRGGSSSIDRPSYWWYVARARLLPAVLRAYTAAGGRVLDVGSADGPSVGWLPDRVPLDVDPRGLRRGGVCASADQLPFAASTFDVVTAFDVVEHFADDGRLLAELHRVLKPGGTLLISVPAYQWAWSEFDVRAGHHRRYTRRRIDGAVRAAGFSVQRATYAFMLTLPFFTLSRLWTKLGRGSAAVSALPASVERVLLGLTGVEERLLSRWDLPAGSSIFLAARS
ncbi:MAG: methyltransferase domain-containing protein [Euzebyales bacterium]|nr:methyltransferase domain-containing protein [Euzebyales bacterium]